RFLLFEVIDQGIGISESQQQRLFQAYSQADDTIHRRFGGTGLGLVISQQLARMLGGSIACKSALGQGSTFTVMIDTGVALASSECETVSMEGKLPTTHPPHKKPEPIFSEHSAIIELLQESDDLSPSPMPLIPALVIHHRCTGSSVDGTPRIPKILVADDYPDNLRLIAYLLKKCGARVEEATHGKMAVNKVLQAPETDPFDLVLMDMKMPELDGYSATRELRNAGYSGKIIALTAQTMSGDRDRCLVVGCDDYLTKPIAPEVFWRVLSKHLNVEPLPSPPFPNGVG
ncbi:MAG: response regulator, partial [Planctomycetaceae bacterium]|nr:response regulator [Planctomycetaceae bacterium]